MSPTLIQPRQIENIAQLNAVGSSTGCSCGHYTFYSSICGHVYRTYQLKCGNHITRSGQSVFCRLPAERHIMRNHAVAVACDDCRGMAMFAPRPSANPAAAPSTGHFTRPQTGPSTQHWPNTAFGYSAPFAAAPSTGHFTRPQTGPSTQPWPNPSFPFAAAPSTNPSTSTPGVRFAAPSTFRFHYPTGWSCPPGPFGPHGPPGR